MISLLGRAATWTGLTRDEDGPPLSDGARERLASLRELMRTPVQIGGEEYESLLARVYEKATGLLRDPGELSPPPADAPGARCGGTDGGVWFHRSEAAAAGWAVVGFQATAPDREFRGGGMLGLHCLVYALEHHAEACAALLAGPFPFAAASINMTLVAARLAGVARMGADGGAACVVDEFADEDAVSRRRRARHAAALLASGAGAFYELHAAALGALERARRDVSATQMDFAGCAAAARDEVAVLLAHAPRSAAELRGLVDAVPRRRSGFLEASLLPAGRRRRGCKWFALSTGTLRWYDEAEVHSHSKHSAAIALNPGTPAGLLRLQPSMSVKFRNDARTLSISECAAPGSPVLACLVAQSEMEMQQWCIALAEHISLTAHAAGRALVAAAPKPTLASDALYEAKALGQRFRVCEAVGIYVRTAPDVAATRTGRALMPGDVVTVIERRRIEDASAGPRGRSFLLLLPGGPSELPAEDGAADKAASSGGWVMEHHPTSYEPILVRDPIIPP
ncbi:hypothetical protein M885DRAFT_521025 [Pelagophyceae sp. CCMP2097]|nr:hypothetical protein M885DRAFT_521025 [Pelagophyceae sp. CCMP2097]